MSVDFDLTHFLKETQLQHGLRAEDYARYHQYTTNRLATLRRQLHLANDKKKFLKKEVTAQNATDARHLMLLALYAERCWASAEEILVKCEVRREASADGTKPSGGVPPFDQHRKRLNKAVRWATKLERISKAVGSPRLQLECEAYFKETCGRAAAAHGLFTEAKEMFAQARAGYYQLHASSTNEQWSIIAVKLSELDDRVVYCMQRLGEDPSSYRPPADAGGQGGETTLRWHGRALTIASIKVKDALREARLVPVEEAEQKALETRGPVAVGQSNKVLDLMDRRINYYNDALSHARQDLRATSESSDRTNPQLVVHYFLYQVVRETLRRTLFMAELYARRFYATTAVLSSAVAGKARKAGIAPSQFASPLEVVRLYAAAADGVGEMELLPGVAGGQEVEELEAVCHAGQLLFTGEGWRVSGDKEAALACIRASLKKLGKLERAEAVELRQRAERGVLQLATEALVPSTSTAIEHIPYLANAADDEIAVADKVVRFPPDYQSAPCKPVFVDIAATFVDYPSDTATDAASSDQSKEKATTKPGSSWGWKWGWKR